MKLINLMCHIGTSGSEGYIQLIPSVEEGLVAQEDKVKETVVWGKGRR